MRPDRPRRFTTALPHTALPRTILAALLAVATAGGAAAQDRCDVREEVDGRVDARGLRGVLVHAEAGALTVTGGDGDAVRVRGVVCASDAALAGAARLAVAERQGAAWVEVVLPETDGRREYVRMDLVVEMPRSLPVDIVDGSGATDVRGVAAVHIEDGSGEITVEDVAGAVEIEDNSGEIEVRGAGSVAITDGSGEIVVEGVRGGVHILDDGSGSIEIRGVTGDVRIDEDGSGSIRVEDVGGDFVLERDGSGAVRYRDIRGTVRVPEGRR